MDVKSFHVIFFYQSLRESADCVVLEKRGWLGRSSTLESSARLRSEDGWIWYSREIDCHNCYEWFFFENISISIIIRLHDTTERKFYRCCQVRESHTFCRGASECFMQILSLEIEWDYLEHYYYCKDWQMIIRLKNCLPTNRSDILYLYLSKNTLPRVFFSYNV